MNRRSFLAGSATATVLVVAGAPMLVDTASSSSTAGGAPGTAPVPPGLDEAALAARLHAHRAADGTWDTHLLPFAAPFASLDNLATAVANARALGLLR